MTENKNSKEQDLKEAIENRTEDPDELLDVEDIDTKPPTVAWEVTKPKPEQYCVDIKYMKEVVFPEVLSVTENVINKKSLIRRKDAEEYYGKGWDEKVWEYGYEVGREEKRQEILKLIEEMMDIDQMNPEMTDEALKKQRLFALRQLKQKIEGW